jgi:hypothetical protein
MRRSSGRLPRAWPITGAAGSCPRASRAGRRNRHRRLSHGRPQARGPTRADRSRTACQLSFSAPGPGSSLTSAPIQIGRRSAQRRHALHHRNRRGKERRPKATARNRPVGPRHPKQALPFEHMSTRTHSTYAALHRLGELGRQIDHRRGPDPYPRLSGPAPSLEEVRRRRGEIERLAARHGARGVRVFGSVARGEARPDSDLDVLVEMEQRGMLEQAGLQWPDPLGSVRLL